MKKALSILLCLAIILTLSFSAFAEKIYKSGNVDILWDFENGSLSGWEASEDVTISVENVGINNKALKINYNFADLAAKTYWDKAEIKNTGKIDLTGYKAITFDVILDPSQIVGDGNLQCSACYCTEGYAKFKSLPQTMVSRTSIASDNLVRISCTSPIADSGIIEQMLIWLVGANMDYSGPCYVDNIGLAKELDDGAEISSIEAPFVTPVQKYGQLHVSGTHLCAQNGEPVQLMGMSLGMMLGHPEYVTRNTFQAMAYDWKCDVVRLAVDTDGGSNNYTGSEEDKALICKAANLAIETGMYFLLDWHGLNDGNPMSANNAGAGAFFDYFSKKYAGIPNIIYEVYNEPNGNITWAANVKPYAENMIDIIRANDPDSVIVVGCCTWSQDVNDCADNPIDAENIMYTVHFYSGTHKQSNRDKVQYAIDKGIAIFATEWGLTSHTGSDGIFVEETEKWLKLLEDNKISWTNWIMYSSGADSSVLLPLRHIRQDEYGFDLCERVPAAPDHISDFGYAYWTENELSFCGNYVRNYIRSTHHDEFAELAITDIAIAKDGDTYTVNVSTVGGNAGKRYSYYVIGDGKVAFKEVYSKNSAVTFSLCESGNYTLRVYVDDASGKRVATQKVIG